MVRGDVDIVIATLAVAAAKVVEVSHRLSQASHNGGVVKDDSIEIRIPSQTVFTLNSLFNGDPRFSERIVGS